MWERDVSLVVHARNVQTPEYQSTQQLETARLGFQVSLGAQDWLPLSLPRWPDLKPRKNGPAA